MDANGGVRPNRQRDTDRVPDVAGRFGVQSIPTFIVFKGGNPVVRESGARNEAGLAKLVERAA